MHEIIVDNFAGGGGASVGIELATGRPVTIAINHDPAAILMHKTNHPDTLHLCESVWEVNPVDICAGRPVGLAWFSPDCKHFSKAKGGKPVEKKIRGLAWIVLKWAGMVKPRVIILENVEEFQTWGPIRKGKPIKSKAGQTFEMWVNQLRALGYAVEWRELVAADYGAPTIRKRFFLIARRDGRAIIWPEATHAPADTLEVACGLKKPWRPVGDILDWSRPCPSIFATKNEIMIQHGIKVIRPLANNTLRRIARGIDKFVIKSPSPYIIKFQQNSIGQDTKDPLDTVMAGSVRFGVVSPHMVQINHAGEFRGQKLDRPMPVITAKNGYGLFAPSLIQYHSERKDYVRGQDLARPLMTADTANRYGLAAAAMVKYYGNDDHGHDITGPLRTITAQNNDGLSVAFMSKYYAGGYNGKGNSPADPVNTTTTADHNACILSHIIKFKGENLGQAASAPIQTVTAQGGHFGIVKTYMAKAGSQELHNWPEIRGMLNQFCDYDIKEDEVLILEVGDIEYFIADIGLRMLIPRELFDAQGFPQDYIIDQDYTGKAYTKTAQVAKCGNAVPPPFATALVRANLPEMCENNISRTGGPE